MRLILLAVDQLGAGRLGADELSWDEIPGVRLVGAVLGILLLVAAIRAMFGKGGR